MASIKISELEEVTELSTSDVLPIINENETKKVSIEKLSEILGGSGGGGTTDVDLSNYYTKDEVDVLMDDVAPGAKIYVAKDVYSVVNASPLNISATSTSAQNVIAAAQRAYDNGDYTFRLRMYATDAKLIPEYIDTVWTLPESGSGAITETAIRRYVFSNLTANTLKYYYFSKTGIKMTDGKVVSSSTYIGGIYFKDETNITATNLANYNYVTTSNMNTALATKQPLLTAGDNITIDENNVISAAGGGSVGQAYYVIELNNINNELLINGNTTGMLNLNAYNALFTEFLNTVKNDTAPLLYIVGPMQDSTTDISKGYQGLLFRLAGTTNGIRDRKTTVEMLSVEYMTSNMVSNGTFTYTNRLEITCAWDDNTAECTAVRLYRKKTQVPTTSQILSKTNTTAFTPTSNYHPATKKYVDDAITSAITSVLEAEY